MEYEYIRIPKIDALGWTSSAIATELKKMVDDYTKGTRKNQKPAAVVWAIVYDRAIKEIIASGRSIDQIMDESESPVKSSNGLAWIENIRGYLESLCPSLLLQPISYVQRIYYGAPGTGKSHKAKEVTSGKKVFRTTFHPDTDYASFVGCYKPCVNNQSIVRDSSGMVVSGQFDKKIEYTYTPQIFVKAYCEAWKLYIDYYKSKASATALPSVSESKNPNINPVATSTEAKGPVCKNVCLLIEELNRGNCAQIFGDLFQLLDRTQAGYSEYSILADGDLSKYIKEDSELKNEFEVYYKLIKDNSDITDEGQHLILDWDSVNLDKNEVRLCLPPNLSIVCTMNTSDQSLFPMDSAFKRRWDWEYVPINYTLEKSDFTICIDVAHKYKWQDFLKVINDIIYDKTKSEDKQMGNFFVKGNDNKDVGYEQFISKVMFYLWNEICKDNPSAKKKIFVSKQESTDGGSEEKHFTFNNLFTSECQKIIYGFMDNLSVKNIASDDEPSIDENVMKSYNERLIKFSEYCDANKLDGDVADFVLRFKLPSPHRNELWIPNIEELPGCSIKIAVNKTGAYISWFPSDFDSALESRSKISSEFGFDDIDLSGNSTSGWKPETKYFKIQYKQEGKNIDEENRWIIETANRLFKYFKG